MKINKNHSILSMRSITICIVVLLGLASAVIALYFFHFRQIDPLKTPIDYSPPTTQQSAAGEDAKENAINRGEQGNGTPRQAEDDPVSMEATYDKAGQRVIVTTKLSNTVSWNTCHLDATQESTVKSYDARTVYQPDSSFCGGFTIPSQNMTGTWSLQLEVSDLSGKVYEETGSVTLN